MNSVASICAGVSRQPAAGGVAEFFFPVIPAFCVGKRIPLEPYKIRIGGAQRRLWAERPILQNREVAFEQLGNERGDAPTIECRLSHRELKFVIFVGRAGGQPRSVFGRNEAERRGRRSL